MSEEQNRTDHKKQAMLKALRSTLGVVTPALEQAGVGRTTFYAWKSEDEDFKKAVDEMKDIAIDFAESKLNKKIQDGNMTAIIFYLKTQAKHRGYVERQELDNTHSFDPDAVKIYIPDNGRQNAKAD